MKFLFGYMLLFSFIIGYGQNDKIEKTQIFDTVLVKNIEKYITETKSKSNEFNEIGYIEIKLMYYNAEAINDDLKYKYRIKEQYFMPEIEKMQLPEKYCYINNKLILIYNNSFRTDFKHINVKKMQRKLRKIVKPYLKKPIHIKVKDNEGNTIIDDKNFYDEKVNIHGGIILSIYNNNKVEIE